MQARTGAEPFQNSCEPEQSRKYLSHGIRNELLEEFAKKKEMCHLKRKEKKNVSRNQEAL
jgi:hypothetical protein